MGRAIASQEEEFANTLTHGFGLFISVCGFAALMFLAQQQGDFWRIFSCGVYGSSLVILYAASTCYHGVKCLERKRVFKIIDHCAIYLLIAGSYTPFTLISLQGPWGWKMFYAIWALACMGIVFKLFFTGRFEKLSTAIYLLMGWMAILAVEELVVALSYEGLSWLIAGGLFYSTGVIFYVREKPRYHHAIWHLFVISGSACHYISILCYVLPIT